MSEKYQLPSSLELNKLGEVNFVTSFRGKAYLIWYKPWNTSFGQWAWGCTNMQTGQGVGGFDDWRQGCERAIEAHINAEANR